MVNICPKEPQDLDQTYTKYWAGAISGLIGICIIVHWMQVLMRHPSLGVSNMQKPLTRLARGFKISKLIFLPGRFFLAISYIAINLVLMFTNILWHQPNTQQVFSMRCGWLAMCNLILTIFLGLKNTVLSPIAGQSYDALNIFHRACGYTTVSLMILHSTTMVSYLYSVGFEKYLNLPGQYAAAVAGFSFLTIAVTAFRPIRKRFYEFFYVLHIALVITVLVTVYIHMTQINWFAKTFPIVGAVIWAADRLVRYAKWAFFTVGNNCTLTALPGGATKVVMKRKIHGRPGSHAFLAIPRIRPLQTHPFTLACSNPATFVIAPQSGFTKSLHRHAMANPGKTYHAAIEGPYGHVPNVHRFDRIVLVGGGSGATFTVALAMDWLSKQTSKEAGPSHTLKFIWAIKTKENLMWFDKELMALNNSPHVDIEIYITSPQAKADPAATSSSEPGSSDNASDGTLTPSQSISRELSKGEAIRYGRPDVTKILTNAIDGLTASQRVLVAGSGPPGLLKSTRFATKALTTAHAPSIEMHLEEFDW